MSAGAYAETPRRGGTIRFMAPYGSSFANLDIHTSNRAQDEIWAKAIHRSLYNWDAAANKPVLDLAKEVKVSDDRLVYTYKLRDDAWMSGGTALQGYWERAVAIPEPPGRAAITYGWYRDLLQYMLDNEWYTWFAKLVAVGEVLVGLGLLVGALVGIAAFFGTVLNFNFMLAGTVSTNPVLFGLTVFLVLGWKVAGWLGLDRYLLPMLGTPWQLGEVAGPRKDAPIIGRQPKATH